MYILIGADAMDDGTNDPSADVIWISKTTTHTVHWLHFSCYDGIIDTEDRSTF